MPEINLPTWDEMSDLDKGAALMHLHKREWEGASYAVENYPARYLDDPRLVALGPREASRHAVSLADDADGLGPKDHERLYNLALDEPERRKMWAARNSANYVVTVSDRAEAVELLTKRWPSECAEWLAMPEAPPWLNPVFLDENAPSRWALLTRDEPGGEWREVPRSEWAVA